MHSYCIAIVSVFDTLFLLDLWRRWKGSCEHDEDCNCVLIAHNKLQPVDNYGIDGTMDKTVANILVFRTALIYSSLECFYIASYLASLLYTNTACKIFDFLYNHTN